MSAPMGNKNLLQRRQYIFKSQHNPFLKKLSVPRCKKIYTELNCKAYPYFNFCYSIFAIGFSYWNRAEYFTVAKIIFLFYFVSENVLQKCTVVYTAKEGNYK
jgi:hypothetical protein